MLVTIFSGGLPNQPSTSYKITLNPDCPIRLIYDFIREELSIPDEYELDVCDESGNLLNIYDQSPWEWGTQFMIPRTSYHVVLLEKDEQGRLKNPYFKMPSDSQLPTSQISQMKHKIGKFFQPSSRNLKVGRIRSAIISTSSPNQ